GAAAMAAALTAAAGGLDVVVLEKSPWLGGTSAMSGASTWVPANHHMRAAGLEDSEADALAYLRAASPEGWAEEEDALWRAYVAAAPRMLEFLEAETPLRFRPTGEVDPLAEKPGGKTGGRNLSIEPLRKRVAGRFARRIRPTPIFHIFTYIEMTLAGTYHHPFKAVFALGPRLLWRWITGRRGQGTALIAGLTAGCLAHGCRIELDARAVELETDPETGGVAGVVVASGAEDGGTKRRFGARRGIVLATGGFEWNAALREKYFPGPTDWICSPRANEGDGQILAERAGARLARMDQANIHPAVPTVYEGKPHAAPVAYHAEPHSIIVDHSGRRFVSELDYNFGEALDKRDPATGEPLHLPAWLIADRRFLTHSLPFRWFAAKDRTWMRRAPNLDALAEAAGLPAEALKDEVARFNRFCEEGADKDFRRGESLFERARSGGDPRTSLKPILRPPFVAVPMNRVILGTKGGARTNDQGQVLRPDGSVIAGLYCAGNTMANPFGTRNLGSGTTIGPGMTWGYICAHAMLRDNRQLGGEGQGR
ncbi:MAG: FAD-binding protein, partial [Rhodospirillaceae bacterium]|nr:FAD-binding protein [Rhodospirillaceae bacterium]